MKKLGIALKIVLIVVLLAAIGANACHALNIDAINSGKQLEGNVNGTMLDVGSTILTIVTNVGMILAVVLVAILGVRYMMGSTEDKAEYKKSMIPYLVGAVLVFGASAIGKAVINFGKTVGSSTTSTQTQQEQH